MKNLTATELNFPQTEIFLPLCVLVGEKTLFGVLLMIPILHMIRLQRAISRYNDTQLALALIDEVCVEFPIDDRRNMLVRHAANRLCLDLDQQEERLNEEWLSEQSVELRAFAQQLLALAGEDTLPGA